LIASGLIWPALAVQTVGGGSAIARIPHRYIHSRNFAGIFLAAVRLQESPWKV
jgi:hypothetical protein